MKSLLACAIALVLGSTLLLVVKSKSQPTSGAQIPIVTSGGTALASVFDGLSPTRFGQQAVLRSSADTLSGATMPKTGRCQNTKGDRSSLQDRFDGGKLISACFTGQCAGNYIVLVQSSSCRGVCPLWTYTIDREGGDPNTGEFEDDVDCSGTCCTSYDTCYNKCDPDLGC